MGPNDGGAKQESKEFPVAVSWDGELLDNHFGAGDVDEGAGGNTGENDRVDITSFGNSHADGYAERGRERKDRDQLAAKAEVVGEGLNE